MVGCKFEYLTRHIIHKIELIDTWWDVNSGVGSSNCSKYTELIDTWWDVNSQAENAKRGLARINRYMVGCK